MGALMGLNSGSHKGGAVSKAKSDAHRAKNRAYILTTMEKLGRPITISDVAWAGKKPDRQKLEKSVARRELQEMVMDNLITARPGYANNLLYTLIPRGLMTKRWRKTEPDTSSMPRYY